MTTRRVRSCEDPAHTADRPRAGAVLLAAGRSSRFDGGNKLLAPVGDVPLVRHAAKTLAEAAVEDVVVVLGHEAPAVREALSGLGLSFRVNADYADGQSTSVRAGVDAAIERDWDATVFALGDMPFVDPASVDALLERCARGTESIVAAAYDGQRGNPVLFRASQYEALGGVTGDRGGRRLLEDGADLATVETGDPGVVRDVDVQSDLSGVAQRR